MSYTPHSLIALIQQIQEKKLLLPHIQRPFVWDKEQMQRLFDSLMRNYPIQTMLFWKTTEAIRARRFMEVIDEDADLSTLYEEQKSHEGEQKIFVLDGQQRLQTLYCLFAGAILGKESKEFAWANLLDHAEDVDDEGIAFHLKFSREQPGDSWYRLCDLMGKDKQKTNFEVYQGFPQKLQLEFSAQARMMRVLETLQKIISILTQSGLFFWATELDGTAQNWDYGKVRDIFVRVNSGGTRLDAADLLFATLKEGWSDIEANLEHVAAVLNSTSKLDFDMTQLVRSLVVAHGYGADLSPKRFNQLEGEKLIESLQSDWKQSSDAFMEMRDLIQKDIKLFSSTLVSSYGSFIPIFDYLYHNPKPTPIARKQLVSYFYKAQVFNWFKSSTDSTINALHNLVGKSALPEFPMKSVLEHFSKGTVALADEHFQNARLRKILLNIVYVEYFGGSPFDVLLKDNKPEIDHIYPKSALLRDFKLSSEEIDHIGNFRFLGSNDNKRKRAEKPDSYFAALKAGGVDIGRHLILDEYSNNPLLLEWNVDTYRKFRDERAAVIRKTVTSVIDLELVAAL